MSYTFTINATGSTEDIPVNRDLAGYALKIVLDKGGSAAPVEVTSGLVAGAGKVTLTVPAASATTFGSTEYQLIGTKSGVDTVLQNGRIRLNSVADANSMTVTVANPVTQVQSAGRDRDSNIKTILLDPVGRQKISHAQPDPVSADLVAIGDALIVDLDSLSDVQFFFKGAAHVGYNLTFEYSPNTTAVPGYSAAATPANGDWYPLLAKNVGVIVTTASTTGVLTSNSISSYEASVPGAIRARVRVTARTSGTLTASAVPTTAARSAQIGAYVSGSVSISGSGTASAAKAEDAAHVSGDLGVAVWGVRATTPPVAPTSAAGDYGFLLLDAEGKFIPVGAADPINTIQSVVDLTLTTDVALFAAGAAGIRAYITDLTFSNTGAAAATVIVDDGATRVFSALVSAGSTFTKTFSTPLRGTAATALNAKLGVAGTVTVSAQGYRGI